MIRLYTKDFKKLKHGQLLWYIQRFSDNKVELKPFKYISSHRAKGFDIYRMFNYQVNRYEDYWVAIVLGKREGNVNIPLSHAHYFARVTKREEGKFIAAILY